MAPTGRLAFSATEWVIDRIHGHAAYVRPLPQPSVSAGPPDRYVLVLDVSDLSNRGETLDKDMANFARRHLDRCVFAFFGDELNGGSRAPGDLAALARLELHVVDQRAERDVFQRQRVPWQDVDVWPGHDRIADLEASWLQDVALFAVRVGHQSDTSRAVRIVFDRRHLRRNAALVALEVDDAVHPLVATAAPPGRQLATVVAPAGPMQRLGQRLVRLRFSHIGEHLDGLKPLTR